MHHPTINTTYPVVLKFNLTSSTVLLFYFNFAFIFGFKVAVARREEIIKRQDEAIRSLEVILNVSPLEKKKKKKTVTHTRLKYHTLTLLSFL